jgi:hypothetical protein
LINELTNKYRTIAMAATGSVLIPTFNVKNVGLVVSWTANNAPNGTITFQGGNNSARLVSWTRVAVPSSPAGSAGSWEIEIPDYCLDYLQITYTRASGGTSDTLAIDISAKG